MVDIMSKRELTAVRQFHHESSKDMFSNNEHISSEYIAHMSKKLTELAFNARLESMRHILLNVRRASGSSDLNDQFPAYGRTDASNNMGLSIG